MPWATMMTKRPAASGGGGDRDAHRGIAWRSCCRPSKRPRTTCKSLGFDPARLIGAKASRASRPCATPWTRSTPPTKPNAGLRSWPARCSPASRLSSWSRAPCLCRAPRQHRSHLQEAGGTARHGRRDRGPQGTAPDRQRGHPRPGAGRRPADGLSVRPEPD